MSDELPRPAETDAAASPAEPEGPKETITEVVGTFKDVDVKFRDVWQDNLEEQFEVSSMSSSPQKAARRRGYSYLEGTFTHHTRAGANGEWEVSALCSVLVLCC